MSERLTAEWCRVQAFAYMQRAGGNQHEAFLAEALRIAARVLEKHAVGTARDIFEYHYDADPSPRGKVTGMEAVFNHLKNPPND